MDLLLPQESLGLGHTGEFTANHVVFLNSKTPSRSNYFVIKECSRHPFSCQFIANNNVYEMPFSKNSLLCSIVYLVAYSLSSNGGYLG
jgi:hypothetical protein